MSSDTTPNCTCDGTPVHLPAHRTISEHHETCPVNKAVGREYNLSRWSDMLKEDKHPTIKDFNPSS